MRVAIVHDYLTQRGGAERVVLAMLRAFPDAELHTSLYDPDGTFPEFEQYRIRTMPINLLAPLRRNHRAALPLLAPSFRLHHVNADVVICSSSGWAHGVHTSAPKLVYCYTPARWLYDTPRYLGTHRMNLRRAVEVGATHALGAPLRLWDQRAARTAQVYVAISRVVRDRIKAIYGVEPVVLPPPVTIGTNAPRQQVPGIEPGFLLCVSRLLPYKNVESIVDAMTHLPQQRLAVVGCGPESRRIRQRAGRNVLLLGAVSDAQMRWLYSNCVGVIAASYEDFGLVPVEAAAFGKPTAALRWGGYLDTVVDGVTGALFSRLKSRDLVDAARCIIAGEFDADALRRHARSFSEDAFAASLRALVDAVCRQGSRGRSEGAERLLSHHAHERNIERR